MNSIIPNWTYLYALPAAITFFWPVYIFLRNRRINSAQWILCVTQLLSTIGFLTFMVWLRNRMEAIYAYDMIFMWTVSLCVPMFYMAVCTLTNPRGVKLRNRYAFLPALLYCSFLLGIALALGDDGYTQYSAETKALGVPPFETGNTAKNMMIIFSHYGYPVYIALYMLAILIISMIKIHRFHQRFNRYYAAKVNQPHLSDRPILYTTLAIVPLIAVGTIISYSGPVMHKWLNIGNIAVITLLEMMMGYYISKISYTAADLARAQREDILRQEVNEHKKITII